VKQLEASTEGMTIVPRPPESKQDPRKIEHERNALVGSRESDLNSDMLVA
jgi:hypothetical protein